MDHHNRSDSKGHNGILRVVGQTQFVAGELTTLELEYVVDQSPINRGGHLWLFTDIRQISDAFQATDPRQYGHVEVTATHEPSLSVICPGETRPGDLVRTLDLLPSIPEFLHAIEVTVRSAPLASGEVVQFKIGAGPGWHVPRHSIDEFNFWLIPDPDGEWRFDLIDDKYHAFLSERGNQKLPEMARTSISIHPGEPRRLDVAIPSDHSPSEPLKVQIRSFDEFENVDSTESAHVNVAQATTQNIRGNGVTIRVVKDRNPSIVRLEATTPQSGLTALSNPSRLISSREPEYHTYWGILHGMFFNQRPLDYYFEYAREVAALDFCAGQHFTYEAALPGVWDRTREAVLRHCDPGQFVTFLSVECDPGPCGHKIILFRDTEIPPLLAEQRPAVHSDPFQSRPLAPGTIQCDSLEELWQTLHTLGEECVMVTAHHTADWGYHDPMLQRLAEIYSKWGTCEYPGNPLDLRPANPPREYVQEALERGYKLGIIAGGDTHDSRPGSQAPEPFGVKFPDGLTAVLAKSLTREAIWEALWQRRTYGTTGARILLQFKVNETLMGGEAEYYSDPVIQFQAVGTAPIRLVELLRNNRVIQSWQDVGDTVSIDYRDRDLTTDFDRHYYVRLTQEDDQMAWTSPVWLERQT